MLKVYKTKPNHDHYPQSKPYETMSQLIV
jgi:hypothetical protein